jgi:hypothetical protein
MLTFIKCKHAKYFVQENFGIKSSYDSCNSMMDQDCKRTSKQDQCIVVMQWQNVWVQMEWGEFKLLENCRLPQGDRSQYFFLQT